MLFTENQLSFAFKNGVHLHEQMTDNEIIYAIDTLSDLLMMYGFDKDYEVTEEGAYCESIIDILASI